MEISYLDASSGMPTRREVLEAMLPFFTEEYGNISSIHSGGTVPKRAVDRARAEVASLVNVAPKEIIFTSGATESINLALRGPLPHVEESRKKLVISAVDHASVTAAAGAVGGSGYDLSVIPVDGYGAMDPDAFGEIIDDKTALVSIPFASQEVGTLQPIREITQAAHEAGSLVHVDLTMAAFQCLIDLKKLDVDMATLSGNDLMGPKGVGALYRKEGVKLSPIIRGGGHERGFRSGSENVPGIVGMGRAAVISEESMDEVRDHLLGLREELISSLLKIPDSHLNGHPRNRLPNNVNVRFDYIEGESMLMLLDMGGVAVGTGSACSSRTLEASPTLLAMGLSHDKAHGSMQITLNPLNDHEDIKRMIEAMPGIVENLREMSPLYNAQVK